MSREKKLQDFWRGNVYCQKCNTRIAPGEKSVSVKVEVTTEHYHKDCDDVRKLEELRKVRRAAGQVH